MECRMAADRVHRFDIDGQDVMAYESDGHRLWRCHCERFQRSLGRGQEGRCPHVAVAIWRATMEGIIQRPGAQTAEAGLPDLIGSDAA
jgi:hypothetical protein